jgi:hypothetical protein
MKPVARDENIGTTFKITLYNEQLYSLIVGSKVALFLPLEKKHSQLNLLCQLYSLGKANSTFFDAYLFNFFFTYFIDLNLEILSVKNFLYTSVPLIVSSKSTLLASEDETDFHPKFISPYGKDSIRRALPILRRNNCRCPDHKSRTPLAFIHLNAEECP